MLKLGVKKNLKTHDDHETAADVLNSYIDEIGDEGIDHKQVMDELEKLYKMLKYLLRNKLLRRIHGRARRSLGEVWSVLADVFRNKI